jgi:hypothetical protein
VTSQDNATIESLAGIGISITPHATSGRGWGWSIQNDKMIRDWQGPYATPTAAANAGLSWLLEYAHKGLLYTYAPQAPVIDEDPLAPWERFFEEWDVTVE